MSKYNKVIQSFLNYGMKCSRNRNALNVFRAAWLACFFHFKMRFTRMGQPVKAISHPGGVC